MKSPPILLFDLGGVIVDFRGGEGLRAMTEGAYPIEFCRDQWWRLPELDLMERGAISPELFADAFIREWRLDIGRDAFLRGFKHWVLGVFDGVPALLGDLGARHRLACLSNVNPTHWARCLDLGVDSLFDECFLSHELRLRKPEAEIYARVAKDLGVAPSDVFFFDDAPANVDAAIAAGMRAALVENRDVRSALVSAGLV
ncbi:MAG: HAD family hydrolase [Pseudomonadota bacterium]